MGLLLRRRIVLVSALAIVASAAGLSARAQGGPPQAAAGPQTPDPKTGLLMGQVIDADTNQPIAGAIVRLVTRSAAATPAARGVPTPPPQLVELTDSEGRFLFRDLPKGNAMLSATASGFMAPVGPGGGRGGPATRPIQLAEGEHLFDQKIRLVRFATISGMVVDEAGEPAVGFPIQAVKRKAPGSAPTPAPSDSFAAVTDDRGMYRISQISPGDYFIVAPQTQMTMPAQSGDDMISGLMSGGMGGIMGDLMSSGGAGMMGALGGVRVGNLMWSSGASGGGGFGGAMMGGPPGSHLPGPPPPASGRLYAYQTTFYPAALTPSLATSVTLRSGENRDGIDFQLRPVVTSRVSGTVTGPAGPVKNTTVRLVPFGGDAGGDASFDVATAMTANDGSFTMLGVPGGQYVVKVEKAATPDFRQMMADSPEMAAAMPPGFAAFMPQGSKESLSAEAVVGVGDVDTVGVTLVMVPGAHIAGHLEFDGTTPKPTAQLMQSVVVSATPVGGMSFSSPSMEKVSATGDFKTAGFPPGKYNLNVAGGINPWMLKSMTLGGRDIMNEAIELKGTDVTDVVMTFTDQISNITGTVKAPATGGFESVSVVYVPAEYQKWFASGGMQRRNPIVAPGANGAFTIGRVPPGDYLIIAVDNGVLESTQGVDFYDRLARLATRITVNVGEKKTVTLDVTKVIK